MALLATIVVPAALIKPVGSICLSARIQRRCHFVVLLV
jgi:hypothetical protein